MITAVARRAVKYVAMFHFNPNKVAFFLFFTSTLGKYNLIIRPRTVTTCGDNNFAIIICYI